MKIYTLGDILKTEHLGDEKYVRVEEVERLEKEKEWLINGWAKTRYITDRNGGIVEETLKQITEFILKDMQQALKG